MEQRRESRRGAVKSAKRGQTNGREVKGNEGKGKKKKEEGKGREE